MAVECEKMAPAVPESSEQRQLHEEQTTTILNSRNYEGTKEFETLSGP